MDPVVIIGGGFAGLYAAKKLGGKTKVTLIDRHNHHLFQPLLYQVATGSLAPGEIAAPLRGLLHRYNDTSVLLATAKDIDPERHTLILDTGEIAYSSLIVAAGMHNFYFGHDDWKQFAPALKSIDDAATIRNKILYAFEEAELEPDPEKRKAWLTFVVVGAGPTGVELAGALAEIARDTLRHDFRHFNPEDAQIFLLDSSAHVLPTYPEDLSLDAARSLVKLGVQPRTNVRVTGIDPNGVTFQTKDGPQCIPTHTAIWAAGVAPSEFGQALAKRAGAELTRQGQVRVQPDLTIANHPNIFVVGDLAYLEQAGKPLPGVAPAAMQEGRYAAKVILARLRGETVAPFHYHDKGSLAVIGRAAGVAEIGRWHFHGWPAWMLWLFVHLTYLAQFRNRLLVFIRWGFQYFTFDRGSRLITTDRA